MNSFVDSILIFAGGNEVNHENPREGYTVCTNIMFLNIIHRLVFN
jgi:hypothetical protein